MSVIETFLELDEDGDPSATHPDLMYYTTPKPAKMKGKLVEVSKSDSGSLQDESEISNLQIESEDGDSPDESDFETSKALKTVGRTVGYDFAEVANSDRDYATMSDQHSASSTEDESDTTASKKNKIDLTMVKKTAAGKEKGAFQREVEARQVLVWKECNKVC